MVWSEPGPGEGEPHLAAGAGLSANIVGGSADQAADDAALLAALRRGDERAFATVVDRYHGAMVRLALLHVAERSVAEEVVQEAWLGVLEGLSRFGGRSSLKTWIFRILTNCAKTRGQRERRSVPFSSLGDGEGDDWDGPTVDPARFRPADAPAWPGGWATPPQDWGEAPEARLLAKETDVYLQASVAALPLRQREVLTLRDVQGWTAEEVCNVLGMSETNQRVLLHRGRAKVRQALAHYLGTE
ncbi:MAG TPA: sigma-70 family RNA polymerase sigma factor [Chloroflexota bacterium]|nr:sigma-70 family RNA polymerase sigma factor [Chloroflexota bacterium]